MEPYVQVTVAAHREGVAVTWTLRQNRSGAPTRVVRHRKVLPLDEPFTWAAALDVAAAMLRREARRQDGRPLRSAAARRPSGATG